MKYANMHGYSDIRAHEVLRTVSATTLVVRRMEATLLNGVNSGEPDALHFDRGGFVGHTSGAQRYKLESDESAEPIRIRLGKNGWKDKWGNKYVPSHEPREYYDFNF